MGEKIYLSEWKLQPSVSARSLPIGFDSTGELPVTVPGCVHSHLQSAGKIPDPFFADNERLLSWIHQNDWDYQTEFDRPPDFDSRKPIWLEFEGLDTIAKIYLNGKLLGYTENMFRRYRYDVQPRLKSRSNRLVVRFISPLKWAKREEKKHGKLPVALNSERVYIRKAQYSFGWDWGPAFPTIGIWKPVFLTQPSPAWIETVRFQTMCITPDKATVNITVNLGGFTKNGSLKIILEDRHQKFEILRPLSGKREVSMALQVNKPHLWWPNGMGNPHLYRLRVELQDLSGRKMDSRESPAGIRTIRLQTHNRTQPVFKLIINGKPVFIRGANWIPADSFLDRVSTDRYRQLLQQAADAHMNMLRVWGGGIYEADIFYQICDELGLLVWQDFMFACGGYPEFPDFMQNLSEEITQQINRLQYHPAIALWCGNNENEWIWYQNTGRPISRMPGYTIFHKLIPALLKKLDPSRPYWPSTPYGFEKDPNSAGSGNRHQWNIWSGWQDYTSVESDTSLFVSEFGFQGPANRAVLESVIPQNQRYTQSEIFEFHNKQVEGNERIFRFLSGHLPAVNTWHDYFYLAQLNQGLALKTCVEHWRLRYPETAGVIIWQLNDCWPVTSWSLIDYSHVPKLAYHLVKASYQPLWCGFGQHHDHLFAVLINDGQTEFRGNLRLQVVEDQTGNIHTLTELAVNLLPGRREKKGVPLPSWKNPQIKSIVILTAFDLAGNLVARNCITDQRWKYYRLPHPSLQVKKTGKNTLAVSSNKTAFFLDFHHPDIIFHQRGFLVTPGEEIAVQFSAVNRQSFSREKLSIFHLNGYLTPESNNS